MEPLSAIWENCCIDLRNDRYADPDGNDPAFGQSLRVVQIHQGPPDGDDLNPFYDKRYLGTPKPADEEDTGMTLIVQSHSGAVAMMLYFPDDQHEIMRVVDDEDDEDEDF